MAELEGKVFLLGMWKSYDELEESISMPELLAIIEAKEKDKFQDRKFAAALKGVDLEDPFTESVTLEDVKARILAKKKGLDPSDAVLHADEIGLGYETA